MNSYGAGILGYIVNCIDNNNYVEAYLDEYYIEGTLYYHRKHHFHANLIYGYDDKKKILNVLGYNEQGYLQRTKLFYQFYGPAFQKKELVLMEYHPNMNKYEFDLPTMILSLKEYMLGINSSDKYKALLPGVEGIYGILIYDALEDNEELYNCFISDSRFSYLIYEHKEIMKKRLDFLFTYNILGKSTYDELNEQVKELAKLSYAIMIRLFRGEEDIYQQLSKIKKKEIVFVKALIDNLERIANEGKE